jgi:membrane-associated protease RseP (regulator of RpoE activity)
MSAARFSRGFAGGLVGIALALTSVVAAPDAVRGPQVIHVELEHKQIGSRLVASSLKQAAVEPGGLEVTASVPPDWLLLGFKVGDVIVAENGSPVGERMYITDGVHLFDVLRNGKPLILRVVIHPAARRTRALEEERFDKLVEHVRDASDTRSVTVKNTQGASGVRVIDSLIGLYIDTEVGDIIRTIDGIAITTDAGLTQAIESLRVGNTDVVLDRGGRTITLTLSRKAPLDLTQIKKVSTTRYEVTKTFAEAVWNDGDILQRKVTVSPNIKNGKPNGFAIYEIHPDAPAAKLGFLDGDIVLDVDGHPIDTTDQASDARSELESATSLVVHIERKGKPVTLSYVIKP